METFSSICFLLTACIIGFFTGILGFFIVIIIGIIFQSMERRTKIRGLERNEFLNEKRIRELERIELLNEIRNLKNQL